MARIFSGIQPTGKKHLGNYIGAISQYVAGQDRGTPAIYCVVDLHAITVSYDPAVLRARVYDTTALLLAAGLDPGRCILFRQSDVPEQTELCWLLAAVCSHGDLNRMHQFKEKAVAQRELISAGLFLYPVLQAADILAYKSQEVPVGADQMQHLELAREIAVRFNSRFGEVFPLPEHRIPKVGARIMDLQDPQNKMSTTADSPQGTVYVLDDEKTIMKKFKSAVTDSGSQVVHDAGKPGVSNLIEIYAAVRGISFAAVEAEFAGSMYGDFKAGVGEAVVKYLGPVREQYEALRGDEAMLEQVLSLGAGKAAQIAGKTLFQARAAMGVGAPVVHDAR